MLKIFSTSKVKSTKEITSDLINTLNRNIVINIQDLMRFMPMDQKAVDEFLGNESMDKMRILQKAVEEIENDRKTIRLINLMRTQDEDIQTGFGRIINRALEIIREDTNKRKSADKKNGVKSGGKDSANGPHGSSKGGNSKRQVERG